MSLLTELSDKLVRVEEGNSEISELYYEIKVLGFTVASYSGNRDAVQQWAKRKVPKIRKSIKNKLQRAEWEEVK